MINLFYWGLIIAMVFGWISNIIQIVDMHGSCGMMLARVAGIFIYPLGAILGYV